MKTICKKIDEIAAILGASPENSDALLVFKNKDFYQYIKSRNLNLNKAAIKLNVDVQLLQYHFSKKNIEKNTLTLELKEKIINTLER